MRERILGSTAYYLHCLSDWLKDRSDSIHRKAYPPLDDRDPWDYPDFPDYPRNVK